uniref:Uncharacterized protein n=1 Tax=Rhizophora mucronata TaxID=61149 RepID=A0A2P2QTK6_RHIMU
MCLFVFVYNICMCGGGQEVRERERGTKKEGER